MTASLQGVVLPSPPLYTVRVHPARALACRRYAFLCLRETFLRVGTCLLRRRSRDDSMSRRRAVVRSLEKRLVSKSLKIEGIGDPNGSPSRPFHARQNSYLYDTRTSQTETKYRIAAIPKLFEPRHRCLLSGFVATLTGMQLLLGVRLRHGIACRTISCGNCLKRLV